jgi:tetratricopeptide (TPR) repeat protein
LAPTTPDWDSIEDPARGSRLDCWKEIAAYLGKSEKTVRRWEMERGLPAHRAPGAGRTAVYAYAAELDEWLKSRRAQGLDASEAGEDTAKPAAGNEIPSNGRPNSAIAGAISGFEDAQPIATAGNLQIDQYGLRRGWKPVFAGILAAAAVGAAAYVVVPRSALSGIQHRISSMFGAKEAASVHPGSAAVSDAEKARAHELYLKGRYEWNQRTPDSLNRALDDFTQAIVHDPNSAEAYAGLADTYDMLRIYSTMSQADFYSRAIGAARRAVQLDDSLPEAHRALAFAEYFGTWNFADAEKEFRRAIELNPTDPLAHKWFANVLSTEGRMTESLGEISKAQELDPGSHSILADKGMILSRAGKTEEGLALLKEVERSHPELSTPHNYQMNLDFELGDYPAYLAEGEKTAETQSDPVLKEIIASARAGYARGGERGLLQSLYTEEEKYHAEGRFPVWRLVVTCVRLGKKQEALDLLEEAYAHHDSGVSAGILILRSRGVWAPLKDEPRFQALLKSNNFPTTFQNASADPGPASAMEKLHADTDKQ